MTFYRVEATVETDADRLWLRGEVRRVLHERFMLDGDVRVFTRVNDANEEPEARRLYENEPPKPQQPWENLSETTREHYRQYARNLT